MATTTNYSWTTPDDTDLVKDGAAAIRTLGSSADTTVKDLNPGTTAGDIDYYTSSTAKARIAIGTAGQVLKVNAGGTAPEWGTTADQTPLTTKGDLFTFDTADARLGVGANGTVLTADSAETTGLKWAAPAAPSFVGCSLYGDNPGSFSLTANVNKLVTWNLEYYDTDAFHTGSSSKIIIPAGKDGKYLISAQLEFDDNSATGTRAIKLFKNGSQIKIQQSVVGASAGRCNLALSYTATAVATDEFEIYAHSTAATTAYHYDQRAHFQVQYLGA